MDSSNAKLSLIEEVKQVAEQQLGDWIAVAPAYQPADIHHWQDVYDYACATAEWQRAKLDELTQLQREAAALRKLLYDIDQCAPTHLDNIEDDSFRWALEAAREYQEE